MKQSETPSFQGRAEGQIKTLFVKRLERLIRLRKVYRDDLNSTGAELLDRAIYSTYRDCIDYGAEAQARSLMSTHQKAS